MIEKPIAFYDAVRRQNYFQWPKGKYFIYQEPIYDRTKEYIEALEAENAKLRKLGGTMLRCIVSERNKPCWECPAHKEFDELRSFCCIRHDAAELGIEVDDG